MDSPNHFTLFGLTPGYTLDQNHLASVFRRLQQAVHPDRYANASDSERRLALERAATVNEAYQTLRDPLHRARYLLSLHGVDSQEQTNTVMDPTFLMEQMDYREQLAEVRETPQPLVALATLIAELRTRQEALIAQLAECFIQGDGPALSQAAELVRKLPFFARLLEEAVDLEDYLS